MLFGALALLLNPGARPLARHLAGLLAAAGAFALALLRAGGRPLNSAFARPARRGRDRSRRAPGPVPLRGGEGATVPARLETDGESAASEVPDRQKGGIQAAPGETTSARRRLTSGRPDR